MTAPTTAARRYQALAPVTRQTIRAILVHPASMAVKRWLRDLSWRVKGRTLANPPAPAEVRSVLFVCLGNICRSPFAAGLACHLAAQTGPIGVRFASAGIRTSQAERSPAEACRASARYNVDLRTHIPQSITSEMMRAHDAVVVMEGAHLRRLRADFPDLSRRIFLLPLFDACARGAYERYNIEDPFGQSPEAFEACYGRIARALRRWHGVLSGAAAEGK